MTKVKTFKEILSRAFATTEQDKVTGEKKFTIIDGHTIVTGHHFLAEFEIEKLIKELRKAVANKPTK